MRHDPWWVAAGRRLSSVRARLTVLATVVVAVVLGGCAVGLVVAQERLLLHGIDEALRQRADNVQVDVEDGALGRRLPAEGDPEDVFSQVLAPDGRVVAASPNVDRLPATTAPLPARGPAQQLRTVAGVPLSSHDFRVLVRRLGDGGATRVDGGTLVVAKNLDDVNESVGILESSLAVAIPLITVLLGCLVWWLTGRALRPVESIRAEVARIGGEDLDRRVPTPATHDEISALARTMNAMLARAQRSTEQQRRFVADASHELRSPLTRMRSALEVAIAHPRSQRPEAIYRSLLDDMVDLQRLVEDLLFLARSDAGAVGCPRTPVDLDDIVLAEARRLASLTDARIDTSAVSGARTRGDARQLTRMVRNLGANAARHATARVWFELREADGHCELVVSDDGPGVPPEHRAAIFRRFARLDEARSRDAGGAGLGLAIVDDIVRRHGGSVTVTDAPGHGARFVVRLPQEE